MKEQLIQIDSGYYCAGAVVIDDKIIEAAPIIKWMEGKTLDFIKRYCKVKQFKLIIL